MGGVFSLTCCSTCAAVVIVAVSVAFDLLPSFPFAVDAVVVAAVDAVAVAAVGAVPSVMVLPFLARPLAGALSAEEAL